MKLQAVDLIIHMFNCHYLIICSPGRYPQILREIILFHSQGMIASHRHFPVHSGKKPAGCIKLCRALFPVHKFFCISDRSAKGFTDSLMSKANTQDGDLPREMLNDLLADAGILWLTGSRGNDDVANAQVLDLRYGHLIISYNFDIRLDGPYHLVYVI